MALISAKNITKTYNPNKIPVHALRGVNLKIEEGEFTAIVGPSGSGKTTLLNIIGGLDRQTEGTILVDGVDIQQLSDNKLIDFRKNKIGFVFQSYNLIPVFTAAENIGFIMLLQKKSQAEIDKRVQNLLEAVGITEQKDKRPNQMSGGQQQRVAVARALASKPKFVLADEPTANLDSKSTSGLLEIMENLNKTEGTTFIFSTHDQRVIDRAHRIVTLEDGKIIDDCIQKLK
ncbi:MAG: macrolide ABC transporter ATP-binding protein [Flavobacteriales bacterium]|nr:MAG: macrolide ABC transporter ATP-binding protein [Flavobacteriales bacterium]